MAVSSPEVRPILVVSDATGETAAKMSLAALAQFPQVAKVLSRRYYIRTEEQIQEVLREAKEKKALIVFTFVSELLSTAMQGGAQKMGLIAIDLLSPLLSAMSAFLSASPYAVPGSLHQIDTDYLGRVEAVQYTVKHDDGQNLSGISQADIILVGPSRTAKTPLSIYLAQFGYKVANIPIVLHLAPPKEIYDVDPTRVVGLCIDAHRLVEIREARLKKLKQAVPGYADLERVREEIDYCREFYRQNPKWMIVDVTGRAVEEVATDVMSWVPVKVIGEKRK